MIQCPKCSADNADDSRFCKSCGQEITSISQAPTVAAPEGESPQSPGMSPHVGRIVSSDSVPAGGFTPGTILADRYRIIGLLGRGGMGEVYRADDLKLGQPVALKFLPPALAEDSVRRERFFAEVRITRQLSHPNICRVYDIGEVDGRHFLSMEYIDGEDLASLMKRIGHLSNEKALDIARQLVAGLSVAHERGVLHRDLKPANIMLDGHGRVRITDFGLAIAVGDESQAEEIAGTPAYMAPEQLAGKGATVRSDIYSLGLILYEIYTGKKAFKADTLAELRNQKETLTPRAPSEIREGIDLVVERVIQRCMEKDPNGRPASVAQLAQALPGGDPLAAAIAAGETPSPEMVAASGSQEGLKPWIAWLCLAFIIVGIYVVVLMKQQYALYERVPIKDKPEALEAKARDILKDIGYPEEPIESVFGFQSNDAYLDDVARNSQSAHRYDNLPALAVQFWYRQSSQSLGLPRSSGVWQDNPASINRGNSGVMLDSRGSLIKLWVIPAEASESSGAEQPPDFSALFKAAGIDQEECDEKEPDWKYLAYDYAVDTRKAWTGTLPDNPDIPIRIEAAAQGGKPVAWFLTAPYRNDASNPDANSSASITPGPIAVAFLLTIIAGGGAFFARRNLRMGRGDRRGAARLARFIFGLVMVQWLFGVHYIAASGESASFPQAVLKGLFSAAVMWLMYIALEPFVRRRWPSLLVGWSRALAGDFRDSLVGRDLLIGCGAGVVWAMAYYVRFPLSQWFGISRAVPSSGIGLETFYILTGGRAIIVAIADAILNSVTVALLTGFIFFLVRMLFRNTWVAVAVTVLLIGALIILGESSYIIAIPTVLAVGVGCFLFFRFGFLAVVAEIIFLDILGSFPITLHLSAWYSWIGLTGLALLLALVLYAFHSSLGGRPIFGTPRLDD